MIFCILYLLIKRIVAIYFQASGMYFLIFGVTIKAIYAILKNVLWKNITC